MHPTATVFPNAKIRRMVEAAQTYPWWRQAYPRRYHTQHGYAPTEAHAATMGIVLSAPIADAKLDDTLLVTCVAANTLAHKHGCQYFWVTPDLCSALLATREPEGDIRDTPWPFRGFTLMLPHGALVTERDGHVAWINVGVAGRAVSGKIDEAGDDCLFLHAVSFRDDGTPRDWTSYLRADKPVDQSVGEQRHTVDPVDPAVVEEMRQRFGWSAPSPHGDVGDDGVVEPGLPHTDAEMLRALLRLSMNVCHYLASVPAAVEESHRGGGRMRRGVMEDEWWHPRWVGKAYTRRVVVTGPPPGSHASPRTHWRRGHWRNQAVGEGRRDHRRTWIEPILVMARPA